MASNIKFSGKGTEHVKIKPYSVAVVDYVDTQPNYFKVFNHSTATILCATSKYPTEQSYDFKVKPNSVKGYADIFNRNRLYLYNTSGSEANLVIHSFEGEFDPAAYYMSDLDMDMSDLSISMDDISVDIGSFKSELPTGNNKIGSVDVEEIKKPLPAGANKIGFVDVDNLKDYSANLNNIYNKLNDLFIAVHPEKSTPEYYEGNETNNFGAYLYYSPPYRYGEIVFLSNDSETSDLVVKIKQGASPYNIIGPITLKPGEVLNNIKTYMNEIRVEGTDNWRMMVNRYRE